jgi:hypothetical protein
VKRMFARGKAVPEPVAPPPQGFVQTAVGRVAPLTASAADRLNAAALLLTPYATSAAGRITPFVVTARGRVVPLAQRASGRVTPLAVQTWGRVTPYTQQAVERVTPLAQQALDRVAPLTQQAVERITPLAHQASDYAHQAAGAVTPYAQKVGPLATAAKVRSAQVAVDAVETIGTRVDDALSQVTPAVEAARDKVTAAATPVVQEATKRGRATMAAARGELALPEPVIEVKNVNWVRRVAVVAAAGGVVALVVRQLMGSKDGDWQAARPTTPYAPSTPPTTAATSSAGTAEDSLVSDGAPTVEDLPTDAVEPAAQNPTSSEGVTTYAGEGAYVGSEPPEGFVIKGNERSMKYHTPESGGYAETTAEVWFSSEEAAQEAGFTRALG